MTAIAAMKSIALPERNILTPRLEFPRWLRFPRGVSDERVARMLAPLGGMLTPLGVGTLAGGVEFLVLDRFTTNASAPLTTPRACEPTGTVDILSNANVSIASGQLAIASNTTPKGVSSQSIAFSAGRGFFVNHAVIGVRNETNLGTTQGGEQIALFDTVGNFRGVGNAPIPSALISGVGNYGIVRGYGGLNLFFIKKSGIWYMAGVDSVTSTANAYAFAGIASFSGWTGALDDFRIVDLGVPFSTQYGVQTFRVASPSNGETATSERDAIIFCHWTPASAETYELSVRRTDDNNRWVIRCSQSGGTIKIIQVEGGAETERASGVFTFTAGTQYRIYVNMLNNTLRASALRPIASGLIRVLTYASASFNATATGVKSAGGATTAELTAYPMVISGETLTKLGLAE